MTDREYSSLSDLIHTYNEYLKLHSKKLSIAIRVSIISLAISCITLLIMIIKFI